MRQAEEGIDALQKVFDTLIIIPNQNLFRLANEKTTFTEAFAMADDVLYQGVKGVTDLMVKPGLINLDFADVRSVMDEMGKAMMGTGEATGEDRAVQAAEKAIANPLLDEISLHGAKGVLINITGGHDLTLFELDEAANIIREKVDPDANIIVGSTLDVTMEGAMRVSVVATGIDAGANRAEQPVARRSMAAPLPPQPAVVPQPVHQPAAAFAAQPRVPVQPVAAAPVHGDEFDAAAAEQAARADLAEDIFEAADSDDLPPPAYQPPPAHPVLRAPAAHTPPLRADADHAANFVAPGRRPGGAPSPEVMDRLRQAVSKTPPPRTAAAPSAPARTEEQRGRFGLGSLIGRMAGHAATPEAPAERAPAARQQPPAPTYEDEQDPEQDRIEIPAFLRRQAN
jgi:cell division protein FtsZ